MAWASLEETCRSPHPHDRHIEFWWQLTGYQLAKMVDAAGYSVERQYEILLFHYQWIVPRLGPAPDADGRAEWKSLMADDGSPLEYSWKWNTTTSKPDVRYSWEPFESGSDSSSTIAHESHAVSLDYMKKVPQVVSDTNFTWTRHFLSELELHRIQAHDSESGTLRLFHAAEFNRTKQIGLKTYFLPPKYRVLKGGDETTLEEWDAAIIKLDPKNAGRRMLMDFLTNNVEGQVMSPLMLAMDNVKPNKSRLKLYFATPRTTFASVREIMTLAGHLSIPEPSLQDLRSFITAILGLPHDYPESAAIPVPTCALQSEREPAPCFVYFFDIAPNAALDVKLYLSMRTYAHDDLEIARRLSGWLEARGRGAYCDRYVDMLEAVAEHRELEAGKGIHSYLSYQCSRTGGEPDIKSYFTPEAYHPARFSDGAGYESIWG
ncbi:unnamed protein product [Discula destructiva]